MKRTEFISKLNVILQLINHGIYPKEWREGQALFNMCHVNFPEQVNRLRGTDKDCFYISDRKEIFTNALIEQYEI